MKKDRCKEKLLLHACCGPCSLEPVRVLRERGVEPVIFFSNSNIAPDLEYSERKDAIKAWAEKNGVEFVEDEYDNEEWREAVKGCEGARPDRCRQCYKMRLRSAAQYAKDNGFEALGTTLTISPYQYKDIIKDELTSACEKYDIDSAFEDYSPYYRAAQNRAKEEGVYKQKYCGCLPSKFEAEAEVREMKRQKAHAKEQRDALMQAKRDSKKAYADKQQRKKQLLKEFKESHC